MKSWFEGRYPTHTKFSKDTAMAMYYTSKGLVAAADHFLRKFGSRGISYACMVKMTSDSQEHAFGHNQHMTGSNYWTSTRQFFESERIISQVNLVSLSGYSIKEVSEEMRSAAAAKKRKR